MLPNQRGNLLRPPDSAGSEVTSLLTSTALVLQKLPSKQVLWKYGRQERSSQRPPTVLRGAKAWLSSRLWCRGKLQELELLPVACAGQSALTC